MPGRQIAVVTPADSELLVPIADLRVAVGLDAEDDSEDDALLLAAGVVGRLLVGPTGLGRAPWRQTYRERLAGPGGRELSLSVYPVERAISVTTDLEDPETVDATTYEVAAEPWDPAGPRDLYRHTGWSCTDHLYYEVTYSAGWLMPGQAGTWSASAAYAVGAWVVAGDLYARCTTAGTSGGSAPTWPTAAGDTVVDGSAAWTVYDAQVLPDDLRRLARIKAATIYRGQLDLPTGVASAQDPEGRVDLLRGASGRQVSEVWSGVERAILGAYR